MVEPISTTAAAVMGGAQILGGFAGAAAQYLGATRSAKITASEQRRQMLYQTEVLKNIQRRNILALRRAPGVQIAGTSLLSQYTDLTPEQAQQLIEQRAASEDPFMETRVTKEISPAFKEYAKQYATYQASSGMGKAPTGAVPPIFQDVQPYAATSGLEQFGGGPITVKNTDIITRSMLNRLREAESAQAAGALTQAAQQLTSQQAARGISGAVSPTALLGGTGRQLFSDVSTRAAEREQTAALVNRQAYLDILDQLQEFERTFQGEF